MQAQGWELCETVQRRGSWLSQPGERFDSRSIPPAVTLPLNCPTRQQFLSPDVCKDKGCVERPSVGNVSLPCKQEAGSFATLCHRFGIFYFFIYLFTSYPHIKPSMAECCTDQKAMRPCAWLHELMCACAVTCLLLSYSSEIQGWDADKNCLY